MAKNPLLLQRSQPHWAKNLNTPAAQNLFMKVCEACKQPIPRSRTVCENCEDGVMPGEETWDR